MRSWRVIGRGIDEKEYGLVYESDVVADSVRIVLVADDRLLNAAQDEGLAIDNPNAHP